MVCYIENLSLTRYCKHQPKFSQVLFHKQDLSLKGFSKYPTMSQLDLKGFSVYQSKTQLYFRCPQRESSISQRYLISQCKKKGMIYLSSKLKSVTRGRPIQYPELVSFVEKLVNIHWNEGNPLSKDGLYNSIISRYMHQKCKFSKTILHSTNYPNSLQKFVHRTLNHLNFATRKKSISQKIPLDWMEK